LLQNLHLWQLHGFFFVRRHWCFKLLFMFVVREPYADHVADFGNHALSSSQFLKIELSNMRNKGKLMSMKNSKKMVVWCGIVGNAFQLK